MRRTEVKKGWWFDAVLGVCCATGSRNCLDHKNSVNGGKRMSLEGMTLNEYQELAGRTMNHNLNREEMLRHSLFEMCSEIGELQGIYQKVYQGHKIKTEEVKKEVGDIMWGLAEFCTVNGWWLEEIANLNIEKLKERYPEGFSEERSLNREGKA